MDDRFIVQYIKTDQSGSFEHTSWVEHIDLDYTIYATDPQGGKEIEGINVDRKDVTLWFVDVLYYGPSEDYYEGKDSLIKPLMPKFWPERSGG